MRLEKLRRLGEGKKKSRKLQAFNYADLRHKIERKCEETNVNLTETSNAYRSQRFPQEFSVWFCVAPQEKSIEWWRGICMFEVWFCFGRRRFQFSN